MPFTLSHPAAVLPLLGGPLVPEALLAGAVAPDLPYFLAIPVSAQSWYEPLTNATFSHSIKGSLLVGFPSVIFLVLLFHLVRRPVADLMPFAIENKAIRARPQRNWRVYGLWFALSALIGLLTHIVWDWLTLEGSLLGIDLPFLRENFVAGITLNRFLQHASTLIGLLIIAVWFIRRFRSHEFSIERIEITRAWAVPRAVILASIVLASIVVAAFAALRVQERDGALGLELTLSAILKSGIPAVALGVLFYAFGWHVLRLLPRR